MRVKNIIISGFRNIEKSKTYSFKDKNYITGPNGSGKSTILQAIQLGALGYIPGSNKTNQAIFMNCNNGTLMDITVILEDEDNTISINRVFKKNKSTITSDVTISPSNYSIDNIIGNFELPIFNFNDFISLTSNKQKENLIAIMPKIEEKIDTRKILVQDDKYNKCCDELINDIVNQYETIQSIDDLKYINDMIKQIQSGVNSELKRVTSTIQSLIYYDDYEGETDIDVIKKDIEALNQIKNSVIKYETLKESQKSTEEKLKNYSVLSKTINEDSEYINLVKNKVLLEEKITSFKFTDNSDKLTELKADLLNKQKILDGDGICPFTSTNCEIVSKLLDSIPDEIETIKREIKLHQKETQDYNDIEVNLKNIMSKIQVIECKYSERDSLKSTLVDLQDPGQDLNFIDEKLNKLNDDLVKASFGNQF